MALTTTQRADTIGTYRFVFVRLMETLAGWVPISPELEAKTLFGRHIWVMAQHADQMGHRAVELRAKLHYDRPAVEAYRSMLQQLREAPSTATRVSAFYDAVLPDLARRLQGYLNAADELLDAPSLDIVRRVLTDIDRMLDDRRQFNRARPDVVTDATDWAEPLRAALARCTEFVDHREEATA